ncbi:MAG: hypothetical protein ACOVJ4_04845 [Sphingobacteriaceae bacterium]
MSQSGKNKIDQLFEESLRDYTAAVEPEVWSKIDQQLSKKTKNNIYLKYAAAVAILIGFVLVFKFNNILKPNENLAIIEKPSIVPETPNSILVQRPITTKIKRLSDPRIAGVVEVKSKANKSIKATKKSIIDLQPKSPIRTNAEIQAIELLKQLEVHQAQQPKNTEEESKPVVPVKITAQPSNVAMHTGSKKEINSVFGLATYIAQKVFGNSNLELIAINNMPNGVRKLSLNLGIVKVNQIKNNK